MKKQNGITLIALIITIIVMLILVGVTINVAINGGLLTTAQKAATEMSKAQIQERAEIVKTTLMADLARGNSEGTLSVKQEYANKLGVEFGCDPSNVKANKVIVDDGKYDIIIKNADLDIEVREHSDYVDISSIVSLVCDEKNLEDQNKVYAIKVLINSTKNIDEQEYILQEFEKNSGDKEEPTDEEKKQAVLELASQQITEAKGTETTIESADEYFMEMFNLMATAEEITHDNQDLDDWIEDENLPTMLELPEGIVVNRSVLYNWALSYNDLTSEMTEKQFIENAYYYMFQQEKENEEKNIYKDEYIKNTKNLNLYVMYNGERIDIAESISVGSAQQSYLITKNGKYAFILEDSEGNEVDSEIIIVNNVEEGDYVLSEEEAEGVWRIKGSGSVEYLGDETSVVVPMCIGQTEIDGICGYAFMHKNIEEIKIPETIISIGEYAFYDCKSLQSVSVPNTVKYLSQYNFKDCTSLKEVKLSNSLTEISTGIFYNCSSLQNVTIPSSITKIDYQAFFGCSSLTDITIPDSVVNIQNRAFYNCSSLTNITIPDSVNEVGAAAFYGCSSLQSITIPDSVTRIETLDLFSGCSSLTNVTLPNSVTRISSSAFSGCSSLTQITIPTLVTEIASSAFGGCSSLTNITIPESVTKIGMRAFSNCSSLQNITIPNSVTSIGIAAFSGCTKLENIYFAPGSNPIPSGQPWCGTDESSVNVEKLTTQAQPTE